MTALMWFGLVYFVVLLGCGMATLLDGLWSGIKDVREWKRRRRERE